jgi:radical SAM protein with 4Fe4S-binding SPASM domain
MGMRKMVHELKYRILVSDNAGFFYWLLDKILLFPPAFFIVKTIWKKFFKNYLSKLAIHITSKCNLQCAYCYAEKNVKDIPIEKWLAIVDDAIKKLKLFNLQILGGEPFLHPKIYWFLEELAKRDLYISIGTNGTLVDDACIKKLKLIGGRFIFSFNFDYKEVYSKIVGDSGMYERVFENMLKVKRAGYYVAAFITVTKLNYAYMEEFLNFLRKHKIRTIVERCMPVNEKALSLGITPKQWRDLMDRLYQNKFVPTPNKFSGKLFGGECQSYNSAIYITASGETVPCPFAPLDLSLGNILEHDIASIWEKYITLRNEWQKLPSECESCDRKSVCGGGCKTHAYLKTGSFKDKDPLCDKDHTVPLRLLGI